MASTVILAITSDTHCRSTIGLCPDSPIPLDEGGYYLPSEPQKWLWDRWCSYWERVEAVRKQYKGSKLYQVYNGDLVEGRHHGTVQLIAGHDATEMDIAAECLDVPLALKPNRIFVVRGTEAHVGQSASKEEGLAAMMKGMGHDVVRDENGNHSFFELSLQISGVDFHFTHHGTMGQRPWLTGNVVNMMAAQIAMEYHADGLKPPDFAIRSHLHRTWDTGPSTPVRVIQTPCFQLATSYIHKKFTGRASLADIGGIIIVIRPDGTTHVETIKDRPKRPKAWIDKKGV